MGWIVLAAVYGRPSVIWAAVYSRSSKQAAPSLWFAGGRCWSTHCWSSTLSWQIKRGCGKVKEWKGSWCLQQQWAAAQKLEVRLWPCELHAVLTAICQSTTIPPCRKWGLVSPIWKWGPEGLQQLLGYYTAQCARQGLCPTLLMHIYTHLAKLHRPEQSGFTLGKSTPDHIPTFCLLVETRCKFQKVCLPPVDLKVLIQLTRRHCDL